MSTRNHFLRARLPTGKFVGISNERFLPSNFTFNYFYMFIIHIDAVFFLGIEQEHLSHSSYRGGGGGVVVTSGLNILTQ